MPANPGIRLQIATLSLLLLVISQKPLSAQSPVSQSSASQLTTTPATAPTQPPKIPLSHLYMHFFLYEAHLEHLATAHPIQAVNGAPIKEHLRKRIGLSATEWQSVSASSLRMETSVLTTRAQIRSLASADIQACKASPATCPHIPPGLAQAHELERQRDQAIDLEVQNLESTLGPDSTARLHTYLQGELARHVKTVSLTPSQVQAARQAGKVAAQ